MPLTSFSSPLNVALFGASGGIGAAFVDELAQDAGVGTVHAFSRQRLPSRLGVETYVCDPLSERDLTEAVAQLDGQTIDLVIVAIGMLHDLGYGPEKALRQLEADQLTRVFQVNTIAPMLIAKHVMPLLKSPKRRTVFAALSARVGSIGDNGRGGWYAYRASKAALNQLVRTMSIELKQRNPDGIAVTLHPGTVDTALSEPFQKGVPEGKLFAPSYSASRLLQVIDGLTTDDSGWCFDYAGERVTP